MIISLALNVIISCLWCDAESVSTGNASETIVSLRPVSWMRLCGVKISSALMVIRRTVKENEIRRMELCDETVLLWNIRAVTLRGADGVLQESSG